MIVARFIESRYLVRESQVYLKDKTKFASYSKYVVSSEQIFISASCYESSMRKNSVLEELIIKRLAAI